MFNIIGVILILILPTVVIQLKIGNYADGVRIMGWAIIIFLPVTMGLALAAVPEPVNAGATPHGGPSAYLGLFKRKAVRKLLWADVLLGVAPGITGSLLFFFFGQIKGYGHTEASLFMLLYFVAGLVGPRSGRGWPRGWARTRRWPSPAWRSRPCISARPWCPVETSP